VVKVRSFVENLRIDKVLVILILSLLLIGLVTVGSVRAQLKKEEVNFEVLATVTMKSGDVLWNLAQEYYKDPLQWKYIAELNKIPNERRIPIGTVIYIPAKDAKAIATKVDQEIVTKKAVVDETALKMAEMQKEIDRLKKEYEDCVARGKELAAALAEKEAMIANLEAKIKSLTNELQKQSELEAQLDDMRVAAKSTVERKDELNDVIREKDAKIAEKEARIAEMEWKLKQSQTELSKFESAQRELRMKIANAEKATKERSVKEKVTKEAVVAKSKPPKPADSRSKIAAMAIALVGSIIWMASKK